MLKKFKVIIEETLTREVEIEALDASEAIEKARFEWSEGIHVLDESDFTQSDFLLGEVE